MRLSEKLILFVLAAAVIPLSVVGLLLLKQAEHELSERIVQEQRAVAQATAESAAHEIMAAINAMSTSAIAIDWKTATPDEQLGGLRLVYAQSPLVMQTALIEPGTDVVRVVAGGEGHPEAPETAPSSWFPYESLGEHGDRGQVAIAPVSLGALPVAIQVGARSRRATFVSAQLALAGLSASLQSRLTSMATDVMVIDADDHVIASAGPNRRESLHLDAAHPIPGVRMSLAKFPDQLGLMAVVSTSDELAFASVRALRKTVLYGVGATLLLLVGAALIFTRSLNRRLLNVTAAAKKLGEGDMSARVAIKGSDELHDLGETFNAMGAELQKARAKLTRWNDELKARVDEATADLRAAQAQLLEAQKLAAIGQLGAGVAHEINNPLCGILGNAQLMLLDRNEGDDDFEMLKKIEEGAKRCRDITQNLLRFSQTQGNAALRPADLNAVVRSTLALEQPRCDEAGVTVKADLQAGPIEIIGDPELLAQVLSAMMSNARTAMLKSPVKHLTIGTRSTPTGVQLGVRDSGKGIAPAAMPRIFEPFFTTKDIWSNIGLGLSVAYRVVSEHGGRIDAESQPGQGARFVITLPVFDPARASGGITESIASAVLEIGGQGVGIVR